MILRYLSEPYKLNHGANVEAKNEYGSTPLMTAAASGFSSAAEMVFQKKNAFQTMCF